MFSLVIRRSVNARPVLARGLSIARPLRRPARYVPYAVASSALAFACVAISHADTEPTDPVSLEIDEKDLPASQDPKIEAREVAPDDQKGAFDPETGEINWDCPCLGGMAHGPCGEEFKTAFSCFVYSESEPKGIDCIEKFQAMQDCFRKYPELYSEELRDDDPLDEQSRTSKTRSDVDNQTDSDTSPMTQEIPSAKTPTKTS